MKELSICMTHFNRKQQLLNTLHSIQTQNIPNDLFEIIIVDDVSTTPLTYKDIENFDLDLKLITVQTNNKWWVNPCVGFNTAFNFLHGKRTIIQNAECLHGTEIIKYVLENLKPKQYIAMSALNITEQATAKITFDTQPSDIDITGAEWYCHSEHRPKPFNFCAAVHTKDLLEAGGFDRRFAEGVWFDDDALLESLNKVGVECIIEDSQLVFHQYHDRVWDSKMHLLQKNRVLIDEIKKK